MGMNLSSFENLTRIKNYAFISCEKLTGELNLGHLKRIDNAPWYGTSFTTLQGHEVDNLAGYGSGSNLNGISALCNMRASGTNCEVGCFCGMFKLTSANLSNCVDVNTFGGNLFSKDILLVDVNLSGCTGLNTIGTRCFADCTALQRIIGWEEIKNTITTIKDRAFLNCTSYDADLSEMPLVETISDYAFQGCTTLSTEFHDLPSIKKICTGAFKGCSSIGDIDLSGNSSLEEIQNEAFCEAKAEHIDLSGCSALQKIGTGAFRLANTKTFVAEGCTSLVQIGNLNDSFPIRGAWSECPVLESVSVKNCTSLTTIGTGACYKCPALTSFDMSGCSALTCIDRAAFNDCVALVSLDVTGCTSATMLYQNCVNGAISLSTITGWDAFKTTIVQIQNAAFNNCKMLDINISDMPNLTALSNGNSNAQGAFYGCTSLSSDVKNWPEITELGNSSFRLCSSLGDVDLSGSKLKYVYNWCFNSAKCNNVKLADCTELLSLGEYAFSSSKLTTIDCSGSTALAELKGSVFSGTPLETADFTGCPIGVIKGSAFLNCTKLTTCLMPDSCLTSVEGSAFRQDSLMEKLELRLSEDSPCVFGTSAFAGFRGGALNTNPLDIKIYGSVPATVPAKTNLLINAINNYNTPGLVTIHFSASAESAMKAAAQTLKNAGIGADQKLYYWFCPDGSMNDGDCNVYNWYATNVAGTPSIVFDL